MKESQGWLVLLWMILFWVVGMTVVLVLKDILEVLEQILEVIK